MTETTETEKKSRINVQKVIETELNRLKQSVAKWDKGEAIMRALYFVEAGAITQEQANTMVENAEKRALEAVIPLTEDEEQEIRASLKTKVNDFFKETKKDKERYSLRESLFALYSEDKDYFDEVKFYAEKKAREEFRKDQHSKK